MIRNVAIKIYFLRGRGQGSLRWERGRDQSDRGEG
jgi:hypothetical protein